MVLATLILISCRQPRATAPTAAEILAGLPIRPFQGRLYAGMPYRPISALLPIAAGTGVRWLASERPQYGQPRMEHSRRLAEEASLDLARGRFEAALSRLSRALELEPTAARLQNDAAVAYLERGRRSRNPLDLLASLRCSLRAVELAPASPAARFNLGLALDALFLRHQAKQAWTRYLEMDAASGWAREVRRMLRSSDDDPFERRWQSWRAVLRRRGPLTAPVLRELVDFYPDRVRELVIEELLPRVAQDLGRRSATLGPLASVTAISDEMARSRGDWQLSGALRALRSAHRERRRLLAAHRVLAEGMKRYHGQDFHGAADLLARAIPALRASGSPLAWEAELNHAICVYYTDAEQAQSLFRVLLAKIDQERYPSLTGRALWMLGTAAMVRGHHEDATSAFLRMRSLLLRGAGEVQAAMADTMLGENYELRGEVERGWHHRLRALGILIPHGDPRRRHSVLLEAAEALAERHQAGLALVFANEVLANAPEWGEPLGGAEGHLLRARVRAELGDQPGAIGDAEEALKAVAAMKPGGLRDRTQGMALVALGQARLAMDPSRALGDLERGQALEVKTRWLSDRTLILTSLAAVHLTRGHVATARNLLIAAVKFYERTRGEAMETQAKIAIFEHAQEAFEALLRLALVGADESLAEAFRWAERSRGRYLADSWSARAAIPQRAATAKAEDILRRLPAGTTLFEFAVLPEETVAWVAENGRLRGHIVPISRAELTRQVDSFRRALERGEPEARGLGADLYDRLLLPLSPFGRRASRLVIVPDGPLERIPFAALYDRHHRCYLVEQATVTSVPSATVLAALLSRRRSSPAPARLSALIVGAPDLSGTVHADLETLPGALDEAQSIARLYRAPTLLVGPHAGRERFLAELPLHSILHFAGHSLALERSNESSVFLLAPSSPVDNGEVTAAQVRALSLGKTDLVVLAACRSLAGYSAGREGVLSLANSFLAAGVPSVVAALWQVDDRSSPRVMTRFHALVASGVDPPEALHQVMLECLRSRDPVLRSPQTWAVFAALGT